VVDCFSGNKWAFGQGIWRGLTEKFGNGKFSDGL
jgi:hypothetical protein